MTTRTRAHIGVLLTNLFFATNYSFVKLVSPEYIGPYALNLVRVGVSLMLFWLMWLIGKGLKDNVTAPGIRRKDIPRFFLCGLTGIAINQMLFIKGLTLTSATHASLLILCTPLLITLSAFWLLKEKITAWKIMGLVLGISGAVLLVLGRSSKYGASLEGDMLIILNALSYTLYFVFVRPLMDHYPPLQVMRWVFSFGFVLILPFSITQFADTHWESFGWNQVLAILFIVVSGTFLAYLFNVYGIQHLGATITGSYIYLQPILAAIIAAIFLGEGWTLVKLVAGIMIFAGVFLVSRKE